MLSTPLLQKFIFLNDDKNFDKKNIFATVATGTITYPLYNGYRTVVHDIYKKKSGKKALINFLKKEISSISKSPFIRVRHLREIGLFHIDNTCEDIAKPIIQNKKIDKLGSILILNTVLASIEVKQLGYNLTKALNPTVFFPLMIRQAGTLTTNSSGKESVKNSNKLYYYSLSFLGGIVSTMGHNTFLKNLSINETFNLNINYSKHQISKSFINQKKAKLLVYSCLARTTFGHISGSLYEKLKEF